MLITPILASTASQLSNQHTAGAYAHASGARPMSCSVSVKLNVTHLGRLIAGSRTILR
ncbi:MAG: hypothetical protein HY821_08510 [Acidobacteria bacterium]|nr:hypothetical protein [Acidobacteriota bacterium]